MQGELIKPENNIQGLNHSQFLDKYSNSCYTTCKYYQGKIFRLQQHIDRLLTACKKNGKYNEENDIQRQILQILKLIDQQLEYEIVWRVFIVIQYQTLQYHIFAEPLQIPQFKITRFLTKQIIRPDPNIKDDVWIQKRKDSMKLINNEINEVLIYNDNNIVTEGLSSNVFCIKNNIFYTPSTKLCLDGTIREVVINTCKKQNYQLIESENITLDDIYNADEVFVCSTSRNIIFGKQIDDKQLNNRNEEFETKLFNQVSQEINLECEEVQQKIELYQKIIDNQQQQK